MATLRELMQETGPALAPEVAVAVTRGLLAQVDDGPFDDAPARPSADAVEIREVGGALRVEPEPGVRLDLAGVGALLYEMLAGGPVRRAKDAPDAPPRPLAKLREFLSGGPLLSPALVTFVERLLGTSRAGPFPGVEAAMDALEALGPLVVDEHV